jgi:hypothetical protein
MHLKSLAAAAGIAGAMVVGAASIGTPVQAQNAREAELIGFHQLCEKGDRRACIRFGMLLGENRAACGMAQASCRLVVVGGTLIASIA